MEKILDRLSFNDFQMEFRDYRKTEICERLDKQEMEAFQKIQDALGDRKKLIDEWTGSIFEQFGMERAEAFRKGFALGVRLFLEVVEEQI